MVPGARDDGHTGVISEHLLAHVGVQDMVGDVWEWVQDWNLVNGSQEDSGVVARGGSFHDGALAAFAVSTIRSPSVAPWA